MSVIKVENLEKVFKSDFGRKKAHVLKGMSFNVPAGKVTGFLGANGAGKTTTLKCLLGLTRSSKGKISFFGDQPLSENVKRRLGFLPERPYFYEYLTGEEFLKFYGQLTGDIQGTKLKKRIDEVLEKVDLIHARDTALRNYSKGMLQRIGFAQAILNRPDLVILDEPMSGLDPDGRTKFSNLIREVAEEGASVFFSSHLLHDVESLCQELVILKDGQVAYEGHTESFLKELESGYQVTYVQNNKVGQKNLSSDEELQTFLKDIIAEGYLINEVRSNRPSLEEAFVRLSFGGDQ